MRSALVRRSGREPRARLLPPGDRESVANALGRFGGKNGAEHYAGRRHSPLTTPVFLRHGFAEQRLHALNAIFRSAMNAKNC